MRLNEHEINSYLQPFLGQYEDSFQQAWVDILESNPQTLEEITPIIRRVRNKAIKQYLNKKYREESLYKPIGKNLDERFTLESILENPTNENTEDKDNGSNGLYRKIVDFLMGEYFSQKNENLELKRKETELKAQRLRLREELLKFKRDRFESWKKLMEDKGKQKENQSRLEFQLQREKLEFRKEQFYLKEKKRTERIKILRVGSKFFRKNMINTKERCSERSFYR
jgi:hypothetical protein